MKSAPKTPPPLEKMTARAERLAAERQALFDELSQALKTTDGNVSEAGALLDPPVNRDRANYLVRRVGLVEYAAELRKKASGRSMGRPSKRRNI